MNIMQIIPTLNSLPRSAPLVQPCLESIKVVAYAANQIISSQIVNQKLAAVYCARTRHIIVNLLVTIARDRRAFLSRVPLARLSPSRAPDNPILVTRPSSSIGDAHRARTPLYRAHTTRAYHTFNNDRVCVSIATKPNALIAHTLAR